jgi:hypothetical protein
MGLEFQLGGSKLDMQSSCLIPGGGGGGEDWGFGSMQKGNPVIRMCSVVLVVCAHELGVSKKTLCLTPNHAWGLC